MNRREIPIVHILEKHLIKIANSDSTIFIAFLFVIDMYLAVGSIAKDIICLICEFSIQKDV